MTPDTKRQDLLEKYLTDMQAITREVAVAMDSQAKSKEVQNFIDVRSLLKLIYLTLSNQTDRLKLVGSHLNMNGSSTAKDTLAAVAGTIAGLYDKIRTQPVSKMLRDDYVALSLCCIAHEMLLTTATAAQEKQLSSVCRESLMELTPLIQNLAELIPGVVVEELENDGISVEPHTVVQTTKAWRQAWHSHLAA